MAIKKLSCVAALFLAAVLFLPTPVRAAEVKIKLYGGYGYLMGGDLNSGTEGIANMWLDMFRDAGGSVSGSFQPAHYGLHFGGDLIFMFSPFIGIGLGADSLAASKTSTINTVLGSERILTTSKAEASAIPVKASLYICVPSGSGFRMNLHFGVGYYMAKMSNSVRLESGSDFLEYDNSADTKALGFHGGLGFEFDLSANVGLFIEAQGRYAKLGGFKGDYTFSTSSGTFSQSGTLYYEESMGFIAQFYPNLVANPVAPPLNPSTRNVREAKIDFSGGTVLGGLAFRF